MGYFSKYRSHYKNPERYTADVARERRLTAVLERERDFIATVRGPAALSQDKKTGRNVPKWRVVDDLEVKGHKAASIAAALSRFKESDFADPAKRALYRRLRSAQGQQRAKPAGADKRQYNPSGKDFASTVFGTTARLGHGSRAFSGSSLLPKFASPWSVIPCIERIVRREVMFAKGHGGRGYRVPHRRTWATGIPC